MAGIASEEEVDFEVDEQTSMIGSNDEVVRCDANTGDRFSEVLSSKSIVEAFRAARVCLHLAV